MKFSKFFPALKVTKTSGHVRVYSYNRKEFPLLTPSAEFSNSHYPCVTVHDERAKARQISQEKGIQCLVREGH